MSDGEPAPSLMSGDGNPAPAAAGADAQPTNDGQNGNGGAEPAANGDGNNGQPAAWYANFSQGLDKSEAMSWRNMVSRYTAPQDFAKAHLELRKSHDARIPVPGADAKPEDWGKVFDKLGRPKDPKEYKWTDRFDGFEIDDTDKAYRDGMAPVMHRVGLNQWQVSELEKAQVEQMKLMRDAQIAARQAAPEKAKKQLASRGWTGDTLTRNLQVANTAVVHYAGQERAKGLVNITLADGSTLGSHPDFIEMMAKIGSERAEDDREPSTFNVNQRESAQAEIDRIEKEYMARGLGPTSREWAHDTKLNDLYGKVHGSKNRGPQPFNR